MPRPKGVPNKGKAVLKNYLQEKFGKEFNPVVKMVEMALKLNDSAEQSGEPADQKSCVDAWDKVASYIEPKLKAIEVSGELDNRILVRTIDLSGKKTADNNADD